MRKRNQLWLLAQLAPLRGIADQQQLQSLAFEQVRELGEQLIGD